jgi:hypothetical protein
VLLKNKVNIQYVTVVQLQINNMTLSDKKNIQIIIELPTDYFFSLDELSQLCSYSGTFRDAFLRKLLDKSVEKALKETVLPKIKIDPKEVKDKMLTILAERALQNE